MEDVINKGDDRMTVRYMTISVMKERLLALGYHQWQLDEIINETIGTTNVIELSPRQTRLLIIALDEYVHFAEKCIGTFKSPG